ncbi:IS200/IS605 family transposase [Methanonatronarchaeum sp. AMET-Sl]|uniref:IS200/IS605 family transposase n=1 Tax=Methanonatronarchaeum sp. AMET-Sl TaxID=3037654 RepID=UPI00244DAAFF|nr:IS200/IS605 family transposase [Methanonatronarchaeum sp. AMET-Sl]WGI17473.1 IS200/IS605 family transposase [Methanonatronarchaeum sp. AMET-Sl]
MSENRSNHTVYNINYHFVWCPKYRHSVLEEVETTIENSIRTVCSEYEYDIRSLHISPDHVHLFVSAHPKHSPSKMIRVLKSITARDAWKNHEDLLEEYFWGGGFWEESYYVGTAGNVSSTVIQKHINHSEHV